MGGVFARELAAFWKLLCIRRRSDEANDGHCSPHRTHNIPPLLVLHRLDRAHKGDDCIEISSGHIGVPVIRHWSRQFGAVRSNGFGDCGLDLIISPLAEAVVRVRRDIATDARRDVTLTWELASTGIGDVHVEWFAVPRRRMAQYAVPEAHKITAVGHFIGGHGLIDMRNRRTVTRRNWIL